MKLNATQIGQIEERIGAQPIPEDNPVMPHLHSRFGEHTYYLSDDGLIVWEALETQDEGQDDDAGRSFCPVQLASWVDDDKTRMEPHEPRPIDAVLTLGK